MTRFLAIKGSYRDETIAQAVHVAAETARRAGAEVEVVDLRDVNIGFCRNCRECTQQPGEVPGTCVQLDAMHDLVRKIEAADCYVLASPTNFFSVTALFKRFMERLVIYAYWPWGAKGPQMRKARRKKAVVIASSAAPAFIGRLVFSTLKQLRMTAQTIGANPASVFIGLASQEAHPQLRPADARRVERAVARMF